MPFAGPGAAERPPQMYTAEFNLPHKMLHKSRRVQFSRVVSRRHCSSSSGMSSCRVVS